MRNIFILLCLSPALLTSNLYSVKREIEIKSKETLITMSENHLMNLHFFLCGRHQAFFEILEIIEKIECEAEK